VITRAREPNLIVDLLCRHHLLQPWAVQLKFMTTGWLIGTAEGPGLTGAKRSTCSPIGWLRDAERFL